jgi:CheY-like chemotaxis protein
MSEIPVGGGRTIAEEDPVRAAASDELPAVLLVDDQPARLLACEAVLSDLPLRCVRALSGEEALARLLKEPFAAIVLDVSMPGMDGFETARLIRSHHRFQRTPILLVTGVHQTELDLLRGYEVGAIDYLFIPIVPAILRSKIAIMVELYQRRRELEELTQALVAVRSRLPGAQSMNKEAAAGPTGPAHSKGVADAELLRKMSRDIRSAVSPINELVEVLLNRTAPSNQMRPVLETLEQ